MLQTLRSTILITLSGVSLAFVVSGLGGGVVQAQTPLNRAVVAALRNRVQLMPQQQQPRLAKKADVLVPGDGVSTARSSFAELRFNDGSLARMGEQAVFWFVPKSRTLQLSNGTALLLIPPKQGRTQVRTPNVTAGIQGSALFVRYNPATNTTLVGALTDSGIEVFNQDGSQRQPLKGGQMAVVVQDRIRQVYDFDLKTFYQTSDLVEGLNLDQTDSTPSGDAAIAQVQAETMAALKQQATSSDFGVVNPSFVPLPVAQSDNFPPIIGILASNTIDLTSTNSDGLGVTVGFPNQGISVTNSFPGLLGTFPGQGINDSVTLSTFNLGSTGLRSTSSILTINTINTINGTRTTCVGGFPGQGRGVAGGFPGRGRGVTGGFPGGSCP